MKVVIIPNLTRENAYETTLKLCDMLNNLAITYAFLDQNNIESAFPDSKIISEKDLKSSADILITIGGDGTMINAAQLALPLDIPILGINAGKLAYLMGLESDELGLLNKLLTEDYIIEERFVLQVDVFNSSDMHVLSD